MPGYLLAAGLAVALAVVVLRLWSADLRMPFDYDGDGCYYLALVKTMAETGWYSPNARLGQPGGFDPREFPVGDAPTHMALIKVLTWFDPDPFLVVNLFYLLTFPLTALTALFVGRRLGLSYPVALVVGLLYAFTPFHLLRLAHLFLAGYYLVPLSVLLVVRIDHGKLPFRRPCAGGGDRWDLFGRAALGPALIAVLTGMGGIYYALFACWFLALAGLARSVAERRRAPAVAAGLACALTLASLAVSLGPSLWFKLTEPRNAEAVFRSPPEAEIFGLKVVQLVLPTPGHRWRPLRDAAARYARSGTPLVNENVTASLGLVGAFGFLFLLGRLLLRGRRREGLPDGLARLAVLGVLLGTVGGLGSAIAFFVSPWLRAYNRISIYLAFFALLGVGVLLQRLGRRWSATPRGRLAFGAVLAAVAALGLLDQTTPEVPRYRELAALARADRRLVRRVEAAAPRGGLVFQLPYTPYPESFLPGGVPANHLLRPYLHSRHLRWSFGGLRGQVGDGWARRLSRMPPGPMVAALARAECAGIWIDRAGYPDRGKDIEARLRALLGVEPAVSDTGGDSYFDLRPFTERLRRRTPPAEWARRRAAAQHPVVPLWRNGFFPEEAFPILGPGHWGGSAAELHLGNDLDRPRTVRLRMLVDLPFRPAPAALRVTGPAWRETVAIDALPRALEQRLTLPPGKSVIRLECDAPALAPIEDACRRRLVFRVMKLECEEEFEPKD